MPDYLNPTPPPNDPDEIAQRAFDRIRIDFPNFSPRETQMASLVITALALRTAEIADLIPLIPKSIFRWFGANVIGLPPDDGAPAQASVVIYVRDGLGYTIPVDTTFTIEDAEGVQRMFALPADVDVPVNETSIGPVTVVALEDGADSNGITAGTVGLAEALDYIIGVTQVGTSGGGIEAESDDAYLSRLSRRLGLIPRPVLADDFAALAMVQFPEIYRMAALNHYSPGVNEKQTITHNHTGGNLRIAFDGFTTADIIWNASAAVVKAALEALPNIAVGEIIVTGGALPSTMTVEFTGPRGYSNQPAMSQGAGTALTGGSTLAFVTTVAGSGPDPEMAGVVTVAGLDFDGENLSEGLKLQIDAFLQANREWGFVVNVIDPTGHTLDASFNFTTLAGYDSDDVEARAEQAVTDYVNPLTHGAPPGDARGWVIQRTIYIWEVVGVLEAVKGLDRLQTLALGINGGAQTTADQALSGDIPIIRPGNIIGVAV